MKECRIVTKSGEINLTIEDIKKNLVNGNGDITDQEAMYFMALCKSNNLNPFNKEAYLIKFGSQPATMIISKDVFFQRAIENPNFDGYESGLWVINTDGKLEKRESMIYISGEKIAGAWCTVYRKDWKYPVHQDVNLMEYIGKTKDGKPNSNWATKPAVMISKVAEATALRKAFTDDLQGMYIAEEMEATVIEPQEEKIVEVEDVL